MARTLVPVLQTKGAGILDLAAVDVPLHVTDSAMFVNDGATRVYVANAGAGVHVVTFVTPRSVQGLAVADDSKTIGIGDAGIFGPFDPTTYNQSSGADAGKMYVNSDGAQTEVTIVPFKD